MLGNPVFFRNFSNHSARVSEGKRPCRNTSRDDGSRADHTPFPDRYTGQNGVALYFGSSRFTATERSHSRHPEPIPPCQPYEGSENGKKRFNSRKQLCALRFFLSRARGRIRMTRHVFCFDPSRFTATKRSHSRHPEPPP